MLTQKRLKSVLDYDPETGIFTWLIRTARRIQIGDEAGHLNKTLGYIEIGVDGTSTHAHRLAFLYMDGEIPKEVDHVNQNKADNRWSNLRPCTRPQNTANVGLQSNNTSGYRGVCWNKRKGKWMAQIKIGGKNNHLGLFDCKHKAYREYVLFSRKHYGEFSAV